MVLPRLVFSCVDLGVVSRDEFNTLQLRVGIAASVHRHLKACVA